MPLSFQHMLQESPMATSQVAARKLLHAHALVAELRSIIGLRIHVRISHCRSHVMQLKSLSLKKAA